MSHYHRHLGVYGICFYEDKLLVVNKTRGPYKGRYDLPGGSIESSESIVQAIQREFIEETGAAVDSIENIGVSEFIIPYPINEKTHIHHIAIMFKVIMKDTSLAISQFASDDTNGALWLPQILLTEQNCSPLVLSAKQYLQTNKLEVDSSAINDIIKYQYH